MEHRGQGVRPARCSGFEGGRAQVPALWSASHDGGVVSVLELLVLPTASLGGLSAMLSGRLNEIGKQVGGRCRRGGTVGFA